MFAEKMVRRVGSIGFACLLLIVAGCVQESTEHGERVFTLDLWLPLCTLLGGSGAVPLGLALRRFKARPLERLGWVLLLGGPVAAIGFAPGLFLERVSISDKGFDVRSGIWGLTACASGGIRQAFEYRHHCRKFKRAWRWETDELLLAVLYEGRWKGRRFDE
jgi:hypothetical protein